MDTIFSVPVSAFSEQAHWPADLYVIPCSCFGIDVGQAEIRLSAEHSALQWLSYNQAYETLHFDNNRTALWELNERLQRG